MHIEFMGAGWSIGFRIHASLYRVVEGDDTKYRMNLENTFTGRVAKVMYDDGELAKKDMAEILYKDGISVNCEWR